MTTATNPVLKSNLMISIGLPNPNPTNSSFRRHRRLMMNYSNFENYLRSRHCYGGHLRLQVAEVASFSPPEPFVQGGGRGFAAAATHLPNPNQRNCPRLVTNYSNFENYFTIRHNYIRRLLQFPAASYFSSSPEPSPRPLDTVDTVDIVLDIVSKIGFMTIVLGWFGWKLATGVRPCSSFISTSTSHLSNCCGCYNHCSCVPDEQEQKKFDAIVGEEIAAKTFWTIVVVYAVPLVAFIVRTAITKYMSGSAHLLQVGISDKKRIFRRKLHIIAENADTSTFKGRIYVLKEVLKVLLQHYSSCHFAYLYENSGQPMEQSIKPCYSKLLSREGGKRFDKETKRVAARKDNSRDNEYVVVTILVLTRGGYSLPSLKLCAENIKSNLRAFLRLRPPNKIEDVHVLWAPQSENYIIPEQKLLEDFPLMKRVSW